MFRTLAVIWRALTAPVRKGKGRPAPVGPPTSRVIDSAQLQKSVSIDGLELPQLRQNSEGMTLDDGRQIEHEQTGFAVAGGSGTLVDASGGELTECPLCVREAARLVRWRRISSAEAKLLGLCRTDLIRYSTESGIALCPKHCRIVLSEGGERILSTEELEELQVRAPLTVLLSSIVRRDP